VPAVIIYPVMDAETPTTRLARSLLTEAEASGMSVFGSREAAVLVPVRNIATQPEIMFTERPDHLSKHAGEISCPGGTPEAGDGALIETALRETREEVDLPKEQIEVIGALAPVGTFVTSFRIQPFVGLVATGAKPVPNPAEVARILSFDLERLVAGYGMRRLVRRGVPVRTPTFEVDNHLIWGATARILTDLLRRMNAL
jgi:8-oxo-dGTP pyrophosphatase MutT (NUDIX family)